MKSQNKTNKTSTSKVDPVLTWYFIFCCQGLIISIGIYFNVHRLIWINDSTKLTALIAAVWLVGSLFIGHWHTLTDRRRVEQFARIGWYLAETCMALGMLGTVAGFLLMLHGAFTNLDVTNTASLQAAISSMALNMSTALYTTLIGLIASIFLKSQLVNLENHSNGLS